MSVSKVKLTREIETWMKKNVARFIDECDEVNCTAMVEAWDHEQSTGEATLDDDHIAWSIAFEVAERHEKQKRKGA